MSAGPREPVNDLNQAKYTPCESARPGDMTLCAECGKAIQLLRTRNPEKYWDYDFWAHVASLGIRGPIETHKAYPKRSMWDYDCYGQPL